MSSWHLYVISAGLHACSLLTQPLHSPLLHPLTITDMVLHLLIFILATAGVALGALVFAEGSDFSLDRPVVSLGWSKLYVGTDRLTSAPSYTASVPYNASMLESWAEEQGTTVNAASIPLLRAAGIIGSIMAVVSFFCLVAMFKFETKRSQLYWVWVAVNVVAAVMRMAGSAAFGSSNVKQVACTKFDGVHYGNFCFTDDTPKLLIATTVFQCIAVVVALASMKCLFVSMSPAAAVVARTQRQEVPMVQFSARPAYPAAQLGAHSGPPGGYPVQPGPGYPMAPSSGYPPQPGMYSGQPSPSNQLMTSPYPAGGYPPQPYAPYPGAMGQPYPADPETSPNATYNPAAGVGHMV